MPLLTRIRKRTVQAERLLARLRRRQLDLAMRGRIAESAHYAARAERIRARTHAKVA